MTDVSYTARKLNLRTIISMQMLTVILWVQPNILYNGY